MKCSECRKSAKEVYPLGGKQYCGDCLPKDIRKMYPLMGKGKESK